MAESLLDRRGMRWLLGAGAWSVFAFLSAVQGLLFLERVGSPLPRGQMVLDRLLDWYTCAIFTPLFFWMVRRWPLVSGRIGKAALAYLAGIAVSTLLKYVIYVPLSQWLVPALARPSVREALVRNFIPECMAFAAMLGVVLAVEYARVAREREAREARLAADLANAQLEALTAQLQPHFLFNTLHGVSALMRRDPDAAETMLSRLADLLRQTLQRHDAPEIPLQAELDLLQRYLDIQQVRFGDRLTVTVDCGADLRSVLVPRLLLQPLVENALQHGVGARAGAGTLEIRAKETTDGGPGRVELTVSDDGPGLGNGAPRERTGLGNTRRRLEVLYGGRASLECLSRVPSGLVARVVLPLRHASRATG